MHQRIAVEKQCDSGRITLVSGSVRQIPSSLSCVLLMLKPMARRSNGMSPGASSQPSGSLEFEVQDSDWPRSVTIAQSDHLWLERIRQCRCGDCAARCGIDPVAMTRGPKVDGHAAQTIGPVKSAQTSIPPDRWTSDRTAASTERFPRTWLRFPGPAIVAGTQQRRSRAGQCLAY